MFHMIFHDCENKSIGSNNMVATEGKKKKNVMFSNIFLMHIMHLSLAFKN